MLAFWIELLHLNVKAHGPVPIRAFACTVEPISGFWKLLPTQVIFQLSPGACVNVFTAGSRAPQSQLPKKNTWMLKDAISSKGC